MDFKEITSRDNPFIKYIARLRDSAYFRAKEGLFVAEGLRLVRDCADNGVDVASLVLTEEFYNKHTSESQQLSELSGETVMVKSSVFEKIADTKNPQGILAVGKIPFSDARKIDKNGYYAALENISDPANLGAVSRTAEALGISGIILSATGCDPYSPKALRASMGTLLRLPVIVLDNFCEELKNSGLELYACIVRGGEDIRSIEFKAGSAVLIGNEANGLSDEAQSISRGVSIKMAGSAESLNASVAAAIAMWELKK